MDLDRILISDYEQFERYLENIGSDGYPVDRVVTVLLYRPRQEAVSFLRRATRHPNPEVLTRALDLLARLSPVDACPRCFDLLHHPDFTVRLVAVRALHIGLIQCEDAALRHLTTEPDGDVRVAWFDLLGDLGTEIALPALREIACADATVDFEGRSLRVSVERAITAIESRMRAGG